MWYSVSMKRIDQVYDHNVFLCFHCNECDERADINPSEVVHGGVPMCKEHGEMEYDGVDVVIREDQ